MKWVVVAAVLLALSALYIGWLARRVERLNARTNAARAALAAQLDRRAVAALAGAEAAEGVSHLDPGVTRVVEAARAALGSGPPDGDARQSAESDLTRALRQAGPVLLHASLPAGDGPLGREVPAPIRAVAAPDGDGTVALLAASRRLNVARQVYNDAVRDTRALRTARIPRAFRLGSGSPLPHYFDIDELDLDRLLRDGPERTVG